MTGTSNIPAQPKVPAKPGSASHSTSTASSSSSSVDGVSTEKNSGESLLVEGFESWLHVSTKTGDNDTVDRSYHSHGGIGEVYSYDDDDDDDDGDVDDNKSNVCRPPSHQPRMRSRSASPFRSIMGSDEVRRPRRTQRKGGDYKSYELKNARDVVVGSISAIINFLASSGVPRPSIDQLRKNLELDRYFATLNRSMDYIRCVTSKNEDELLAKVHLAVSAWEALCRLKSLEYKRAYKYAYRLRYGRQSGSDPSNEDIKKSIEEQIKIAEQCTLCKKRLYLVHKWQRRVLQRTNRAAVIEPEGYAPIRCL